MARQIFSSRSRPVHLGAYPLEHLTRGAMPEDVPKWKAYPGEGALADAMVDHQTMMDTIRDGLVNSARADIPDDPAERAAHLKAFAYFSDADLVGIGVCPPVLDQPVLNSGIARLSEDLRTRQTKTLASGIDQIMADLRDAAVAPPTLITGHSSVLTVGIAVPRPPREGEPGADWLHGAGHALARLRASEIAVVLANYIRLLGWDATAHTETSRDICLGHAAVASGIAWPETEMIEAPWLGARIGLAAVTTEMPVAHDGPLAPRAHQPKRWRKGGITGVG
ncbi:MAG: NAD-binding oxidoreductase, partial [Shimia sp.]